MSQDGVFLLNFQKSLCQYTKGNSYQDWLHRKLGLHFLKVVPKLYVIFIDKVQQLPDNKPQKGEAETRPIGMM